MSANEDHGRIRRAVPPAIGLGMVGGGIFMLSRALGGGYASALLFVLVGIACMLVGAILLALPVARVCSNVFGSLFYPDDKLRRAPPLYSRAEALAKQDRFDDAMKAYESIVEDYPDEVRPYVAMIELAVYHYRDPALADTLLERGMKTLEDPDDRETLNRVHAGVRSQIEEKKDWQKPRTLRLN